MKKYKNRATFVFNVQKNGNGSFWMQTSCSLPVLSGLTLLPFLRSLFLDSAPEVYNIITQYQFHTMRFYGIEIRSSFDCIIVNWD